MHQFDKVEMYVYTTPEDAEAEHQRLLDWEKQWLTSLELPFRVVDLASGDLGSSARASSTARRGSRRRASTAS
ncbi:hypothetical protein SANTM175S_07616 [Streptomyces antimycoticus]